MRVMIWSWGIHHLCTICLFGQEHKEPATVCRTRISWPEVLRQCGRGIAQHRCCAGRIVGERAIINLCPACRSLSKRIELLGHVAATPDKESKTNAVKRRTNVEEEWRTRPGVLSIQLFLAHWDILSSKFWRREIRKCGADVA